MAIDWQPQSISLLKFDPTAAISASTDAFKGISDTLNQRKRAESLAAFRERAADLDERRQIFAEGADTRAEAAASKSAQRLLGGIQSTGLGMVDPFLQNPETQKAFAQAGITDPKQQREMLLGHLQTNDRFKTVFSDPMKWSQAAYDDVIARGGSIATAEKARQNVLSRYQIMDKDLAGKMLFTPGAASNAINTGSSGGGSSKLLSKDLNASDIQTLREDFFRMNNIEKNDRFEIPGFKWRPSDWGDHDLTQSDLLHMESALRTELSPTGIYAVAQAIMSDTSEGTTKEDIRDGLRNITPARRAELVAYGKAVEGIQNRTLNSAGVAAASTSFNDMMRQGRDYNQKLLTGTTYQPNPYADRKEILDNMLSSVIPGASIQPTTDGSKIMGKAPPQAGENAPPTIDEATGTATAQILNQLNAPTQGEQLLSQNRGIGGSEQARLLDEQDAPIDNSVFAAQPEDLPATPQEETTGAIGSFLRSAGDFVADEAKQTVEGIGSVFSGIQAAKDKEYGAQTQVAIDAVQKALENNTQLEGVSAREYKAAMASDKLSAKDKNVLRKLYENRKRRSPGLLKN